MNEYKLIPLTQGQYKNVFQITENCWKAQIVVDRKTIYLGTRKTAELAYNELYVSAALKYHGEFARLV